ASGGGDKFIFSIRSAGRRGYSEPLLRYQIVDPGDDDTGDKAIDEAPYRADDRPCDRRPKTDLKRAKNLDESQAPARHGEDAGEEHRESPQHANGDAECYRLTFAHDVTLFLDARSRRSEGMREVLLRRRPSRAGAEPPLDVIEHHLLEVGGECRAAQRRGFLAVDEDRSRRLLAGAGERNADVGVLAFARPVDDATHHRDRHRLDARIARLPFRHGEADEVLNLLRQ